MIHNKFRYLLTLVALFAMTTGAWAQGYNVTFGGFSESEMNTTVNVASLPQTFTTIGHDALYPWTVISTSGNIFYTATVTSGGEGKVSANIANDEEMTITITGPFSGTATIHVTGEDDENRNISTDITVSCEAVAPAAQVELKLGAKIKNGDVLTFGDTRVHFTTPCSLPYVIFSAVNTSTTARISYNDNVYSITFSPLVDATDIEYPDVTQQGVGAALGLKTGQTQPEYVMVTEGTGTFADPFILTPYATYNCGGSPVDGKAICDASDPSAIKVDWNKTSKTGSFTMPGGNVTLEPEYYPQAALTAAPTAINDVPATTDGAIVKAGTVANIGSTTTAQGTVMYYVSTSTMTDAALLALAADAWTADVPTAQSLAEGQAYVYYYVRGNDSDTDEENFSDGDILAANALTVTIAAAPTYAVTFAEGTADADKWTIEPTEAKPGTEIKATYSGNRHVKGVKAVKKAEAPHLVIEDKNNFFGIGNQKFYFTEGETWTEAMANHPENAAAGWVIYNDRLRFKPDVYGYAIFILRSGDYYIIEDKILNQPIDTSKTYMFEGTNPT